MGVETALMGASTAASLGSSMAGGKGGDSSPSTSDVMATASPYETSAANIADTLFAESTPLRQQLTQDYSKFLSGDYNLQELPGYEPLYSQGKRAAEGQYSLAKDNLLANTPSGGATTAGLAKLEAARASDVGGMPAKIGTQLLQDVMNKIYGAAYQTPSTALQGYGTAASQYGSRYGTTALTNMQEDIANQAAWNQLGTGLGYSLNSGNTAKALSNATNKGAGSSSSPSYYSSGIRSNH